MSENVLVLAKLELMLDLSPPYLAAHCDDFFLIQPIDSYREYILKDISINIRATLWTEYFNVPENRFHFIWGPPEGEKSLRTK